jgi:hypothetical protein
MFEGFEWNSPMLIRKAASLSDLVATDISSLPRQGWFKRKLLVALQRGFHTR